MRRNPDYISGGLILFGHSALLPRHLQKSNHSVTVPSTASISSHSTVQYLWFLVCSSSTNLELALAPPPLSSNTRPLPLRSLSTTSTPLLYDNPAFGLPPPQTPRSLFRTRNLHPVVATCLTTPLGPPRELDRSMLLGWSVSCVTRQHSDSVQL